MDNRVGKKIIDYLWPYDEDQGMTRKEWYDYRWYDAMELVELLGKWGAISAKGNANRECKCEGSGL